MPFTQSDLETINKAIASGVMRVQFSDRVVEYQSIQGLLLAKADIEAELNKNSGTPIVRQYRPISSRGW